MNSLALSMSHMSQKGECVELEHAREFNPSKHKKIESLWLRAYRDYKRYVFLYEFVVVKKRKSMEFAVKWNIVYC